MRENRNFEKESTERFDYGDYVEVREYSAYDEGEGLVEVLNSYVEVPCKVCGEIIQDTYYKDNKNYICEYCKKKLKAKQRLVNKAIMLDKFDSPREMSFYRAVDKIKKQVKDFSGYERAIKVAKKKCELYASIPEAMVAIELIKLGYAIIPQQKIGEYTVDFAIPKEKLVIEVDGAIYHYYQKTNREATIQYSLGIDWKIIHVPAERISKQIYKLQEVIDALKNLK